MMIMTRRVSVVIVVAMILITVSTVASFAHDTNAAKKNEKPDVTPLIQQEMSNPANNIPDRAVLLIYSNQKWSGNILDIESHSVTQDGKGDSKIFFTCSKQDSNGNPGLYSLTFQKLKSSGYLELAVIQNGKLLTRDITTAAFGVVGINGNCDQSVSENNNAAGTIESSSSEANSTSSKAGKAYFRQTTDMPPNSPVYIVSTSMSKDNVGFIHIAGEVKNNGTQAVSLVDIISSFYDKNNLLLNSIEAYAIPYTLEEGQSAPFSLDVGPPRAPIDEIDHVKYHLTWTSPSNIRE
jgi:hypothetical protein